MPKDWPYRSHAKPQPPPSAPPEPVFVPAPAIEPEQAEPADVAAPRDLTGFWWLSAWLALWLPISVWSGITTAYTEHARSNPLAAIVTILASTLLYGFFTGLMVRCIRWSCESITRPAVKVRVDPRTVWIPLKVPQRHRRTAIALAALCLIVTSATVTYYATRPKNVVEQYIYKEVTYPAGNGFGKATRFTRIHKETGEAEILTGSGWQRLGPNGPTIQPQR